MTRLHESRDARFPDCDRRCAYRRPARSLIERKALRLGQDPHGALLEQPPVVVSNTGAQTGAGGDFASSRTRGCTIWSPRGCCSERVLVSYAVGQSLVGRAPTEEPRSMKRRFTRLPIASIAVVIGSLMIGLAMSPVGAQSQFTNGSVTVRSDGAVYLISNNQRRWVATVQITDEELNAYPEAEPIYAGLVPFGTASAGCSLEAGTGHRLHRHEDRRERQHHRHEDRYLDRHGDRLDGHEVWVERHDRRHEDRQRRRRGRRCPRGPGTDQCRVRCRPGRTRTIHPWPPRRAPPIRRARPSRSTRRPARRVTRSRADSTRSTTTSTGRSTQTAEVEACFRTGKDARDNGYTEVKKN